jgi:tetratricopeptide (TPR) repeat protein
MKKAGRDRAAAATMPPGEVDRSYRQTTIDRTFYVLVMVYVVLLSLFPVRNNDVFWHMAVGREIVQQGHFIREDPFAFTTAGRSWVPHSYLSGVVLYLTYLFASGYGLIVLRALLVLVVFACIFRLLASHGVSWTLAAPFLLVAALNMQGRFMVRPHLFEYLFLALMLMILAGRGKAKGPGLYIAAGVIQILWVNMHPSFILGPVLVLLFLLGEMLSRGAAKAAGFLKSPWRSRFTPKQLGLLLLVVSFACLVDPDPLRFLIQPFNPAQGSLVSKYTLEWRTPFDPALSSASFHPYYEILLAVVALSFIMGAPRLHLPSLLIAAAVTLLSLKAHRFRVEFAVAALPLALIQLEASPLAAKLRGFKRGRRGRLIAPILALAVSLVIVAGSPGRISLGGSMEDRYPVKAMDFVKQEKIGHRSYETIGFGSFLLWHLYPERQSFIDGRNYAHDVYEDFMECQKSPAGFEKIAKKYAIDCFILPVPESCDKGTVNLHNFLIRSPDWSVVYMDHIAYVYERADAVPADWFAGNAYKYYHTMTFANAVFDSSEVPVLLEEIRRTVKNDPSFLTPWLDLGNAYMTLGEPDKALEAFRRAVQLRPGEPLLWYKAGSAAMKQGDFKEAVKYFEKLVELSPEQALSYFYLGTALEKAGRIGEALAEYRKSLSRDRNLTAAYIRAFEALAERGKWKEAKKTAEAFHEARPYDFRSSYELALSFHNLGKLGDALTSAKEAAGLAGDRAEVHALLAEIYLDMASYHEARREAEKALDLDENNDEARGVLNELDSASR